MVTLATNYPLLRNRRNPLYHAFNLLCKVVFSITCRIDRKEFNRIPMQGPLILVGNHINFLEVPVLFPFLQPRPITGFAKSENWQRPFSRWMFGMWGAISIRRGEADLNAFRQAEEAVEAGMIFAISPEGTRTRGSLVKGHPGVVLLAVRTGAPILPVVHFGGENYWKNLKRLRRTDFNTVVGNQFKIRIDRNNLSRVAREEITDQIMYQLSALLPPAYRGVYSDFSQAHDDYLEFLDGKDSNLRRVK
jgi:1-acyl-sn-glycerol-3-phosphate acyltransferase